MKTQLLKAFVLLCSSIVYGQVGINNTSPKATLDVTAQSPTGTATTVDGLIVPRVDRQRAQSMTSVPTSTIIYVNDISTGTLAGSAINIDTVGLYTYDGTAWNKLGSGGSGSNIYTTDGTLTGNRNVNLGTNNLSFTGTGNIGIGTMTPDTSAILDLASTNKGLLIPRVNLTSNTLQISTSTNAVGLMIYNSGTTLSKGFYFWNGTEWRHFDESTTISATATLKCLNVSLDPQQTITGGTPIPSGTIIKLPYSAGNGGKFTGVSLTTGVAGSTVTATISDGQLENGSGYLVFNVSGVPAAAETTPAGLTFNLTPLTAINPGLSGCSAMNVGTENKAESLSSAVMGFLSFVTDSNGTKGFALQATSSDGLYSIRVFLRHSNQTASATASNNTNQVQNADIQIKNNSVSSKTVMWNTLGSWGAGTIVDSGNTLVIPTNTWGGATGNTWTTSTPAIRGAWGDPGIYQGANGGPEFRYYSWIEQGSTKTSYLLTTMAGANSGQTATDPSTMKVYIKLDQITAP